MKTLLKQIVNLVATALVAPLTISELLARRIAGRDVFFHTQTELISLAPGKLGVYIRGAYYQRMLRRCPLGCGFQFGTIINPEAEFGERVCSAAYVRIGVATIGDDCIISEGAHILSGKLSHGIADPTVPFNRQPSSASRVHLGRNCWIGANAVVMADIGMNCVVGAGAVVTRPFPSNKIILGNPARAIADTFDAALIESRTAVAKASSQAFAQQRMQTSSAD